MSDYNADAIKDLLISKLEDAGVTPATIAGIQACGYNKGNHEHYTTAARYLVDQGKGAVTMIQDILGRLIGQAAKEIADPDRKNIILNKIRDIKDDYEKDNGLANNSLSLDATKSLVATDLPTPEAGLTRNC